MAQRARERQTETHTHLTIKDLGAVPTWSLTHSTRALLWGTTLQAIFWPVCTTVHSWNFTSSPFWRQSALLAMPMMPNG